MNNLLSYCGLVDARIRAPEKDLPVSKVRTFWETHKIWKNLPRGFDDEDIFFQILCASQKVQTLCIRFRLTVRIFLRGLWLRRWLCYIRWGLLPISNFGRGLTPPIGVARWGSTPSRLLFFLNRVGSNVKLIILVFIGSSCWGCWSTLKEMIIFKNNFSIFEKNIF